MSTHLPGFRSFFRFLHLFVLTKLVASSIRVKVIAIFGRIFEKEVLIRTPPTALLQIADKIILYFSKF